MLIGSNGMQASRKQRIPDNGVSNFYILENNCVSKEGSGGSTTLSFEDDNYFTLNSSSFSGAFTACDSPIVSISSSASPLSTTLSFSDTSFSSEITTDTKQRLRDIELSLIGHDAESSACHDFCFSGSIQNDPVRSWDDVIKEYPKNTLQNVLISCAQAVSNLDWHEIRVLMHLLEQKVSVYGDPVERVGAYMLEGLRARLEFTGSTIYKALKCDAPISADLLTYMSFLYQICPYWKFAYVSANAAILDAVQNESNIHVIDFQIAQGTQWLALIQLLSTRPGGPPTLRLTGVDDPQSAHARGGGLEIVARRLVESAKGHGVPFVFHDAAISCGEVHTETLRLYYGEAVVVNFPFVLHHMADESVSTRNHRDRLLRLVKSLAPRVMTLVEQESNTNTQPFYPRFVETLDYYTAIFESIDVARPRTDGQRVSAEQHCVARDIVNMIACEDGDRVERHELFGKWQARLRFAGFNQVRLGARGCDVVRNMLRDFDRNFRVEVREGALYLLWKSRAMATSSAWR